MKDSVFTERSSTQCTSTEISPHLFLISRSSASPASTSQTYLSIKFPYPSQLNLIVQFVCNDGVLYEIRRSTKSYGRTSAFLMSKIPAKSDEQCRMHPISLPLLSTGSLSQSLPSLPKSSFSSVIRDGCIYALTEIDPLFLVIPFLHISAKGKYTRLLDIFDSPEVKNKFNYTTDIYQNLKVLIRMRSICDRLHLVSDISNISSISSSNANSILRSSNSLIPAPISSPSSGVSLTYTVMDLEAIFVKISYEKLSSFFLFKLYKIYSAILKQKLHFTSCSRQTPDKGRGNVPGIARNKLCTDRAGHASKQETNGCGPFKLNIHEVRAFEVAVSLLSPYVPENYQFKPRLCDLDVFDDHTKQKVQHEEDNVFRNRTDTQLHLKAAFEWEREQKETKEGNQEEENTRKITKEKKMPRNCENRKMWQEDERKIAHDEARKKEITWDEKQYEDESEKRQVQQEKESKKVKSVLWGTENFQHKESTKNNGEGVTIWRNVDKTEAEVDTVSLVCGAKQTHIPKKKSKLCSRNKKGSLLSGQCTLTRWWIDK